MENDRGRKKISKVEAKHSSSFGEAKFALARLQ